MKKIMFVFIIMILYTVNRAGQLKTLTLDDILTVKDTDNEANLYDWLNNPLGFIYDKTFSYRDIYAGLDYQQGELRREYDPENTLVSSFRFEQKTVLKPENRVFFGSVGYRKQKFNNLYRSLTVDPYEQYFRLLDNNKGDFDYSVTEIYAAFTQRLRGGLVIAPEIDYTLGSSLRDVFIKTKTVQRQMRSALNLGWITGKSRFFIRAGIEDFQDHLEGPSELTTPVLFIELGEGVLKQKNASPYKYRKQGDGYFFSAGEIHRLNSSVYSCVTFHYELKKFEYLDGSTRKDYWGFDQREVYGLSFSIRYIPEEKKNRVILTLGFKQKELWGKSRNYSYLYHEETDNEFHVGLSHGLNLIPLISELYHQIDWTFGNLEFSDYMGALYYDKNFHNFNYKIGGEYLLNENLNFFGMAKAGYLKRYMAPYLNDAQIMGLNFGLENRLSHYQAGLSLGMLMINSENEWRNQFQFICQLRMF